jgi:hypothetical protein
MSESRWFEVDKKGLAAILARRGKEFLLFELVQNAWDEPGVARVDVQLRLTGKGEATLQVLDDAPEGFADLTHAYTLFAESRKKDNPKQRGRFNLGEKLALALASQARIVTTKGGVRFDREGRHALRTTRVHGSEVSLVFKLSATELMGVVAEWNRLIPPANIITTLNGDLLQRPKPLREFTASLRTEIADKDGMLSYSSRSTSVVVYDAAPLAPAAIYEMGIPVCEIDGRFRIDVQQKVPLTLDRQEVLPSFRKQLATAVLNQMFQELNTEDVNTSLVNDAIRSPDAAPAAIHTYMDKRFGDKRVSYDPTDPEANKIAVSQGYTVVTGSMLSGDAWKNVKEAGAILPAGQVTPSPKVSAGSGPAYEGVTVWMGAVARYAEQFALHTIRRSINVTFTNQIGGSFAAAYGNGTLTFNVGRLGKQWFNLDANRQAIDSLLIHELGHERSSDHLNSAYHDALCDIGALYGQAVREGKIKI